MSREAAEIIRQRKIAIVTIKTNNNSSSISAVSPYHRQAASHISSSNSSHRRETAARAVQSSDDRVAMARKSRGATRPDSITSWQVAHFGKIIQVSDQNATVSKREREQKNIISIPLVEFAEKWVNCCVKLNQLSIFYLAMVLAWRAQNNREHTTQKKKEYCEKTAIFALFFPFIATKHSATTPHPRRTSTSDFSSTSSGPFHFDISRSSHTKKNVFKRFSIRKHLSTVNTTRTNTQQKNENMRRGKIIVISQNPCHIQRDTFNRETRWSGVGGEGISSEKIDLDSS